MGIFSRFFRIVPAWAFILMFIAIAVNTLYFIYIDQVPVDGQSNRNIKGQSVIDRVAPGGPADRAGIRPGDILVTVDSVDAHEWSSVYHGDRAGDTCIYGVIRDGKELALPVVFCSPAFFSSGYMTVLFLIQVLFSIASLYLVFRKPGDKAARLLFIYLQAFIVCQNASYFLVRDPLVVIAGGAFFLSTCLIGPLLLHFCLLFPRTARIYKRIRVVIALFYGTGFLIFIYLLYAYVEMLMSRYSIFAFAVLCRQALSWMTLTHFLALVAVAYQVMTIKDHLSRNQLRLVFIGSIMGIYTAVALVLFPGWVHHLSAGYPHALQISQGLGSLVMISCILVAIFRYRIWDIEILIRKTLLYLGATLIITVSYFFLIWTTDQLFTGRTNTTRTIVLATSVFIFLILRDWLQRLIDRSFHRETYDSATVVSGFEEQLAGIYKPDELATRIGTGLDAIFHMKSLVFALHRKDLTFEPAFTAGIQTPAAGHVLVVNHEFTNLLRKAKVFSPGELREKPAFLDVVQGELVVPLLKEKEPTGFFICGPKRSEKVYSLQDIRVLLLIAKRVIASFQTASLYQKDLDRQLMLERERARISEDMHDDVGASLTRISILSELAKQGEGVPEVAKRLLGQISDTSRGVMEEMSQIIWALNPKNDTLEGLAAYLRRFAHEYLEPTTVSCMIGYPERIPVMALSVEVRRNIYLVVREALHNVVKHAGASGVRLSLILSEPGFRIIIRDDGRGFDPGCLTHAGNGLENMKKRMQDIGGDLQAISAPEKGTEIILTLRV